MVDFEVSKSEIEDIIHFVGLEGREKSKFKTYSHGMKQRLGIAQALMHNPELIILDEPTTGLDPQGIVNIRELIIKLSKEQGKTVILSSHQLSEIEMIANRMVIINKGKSIIEGAFFNISCISVDLESRILRGFSINFL